MCARFTVLSDTPIPSAIAGCVIPISRHSTIWMRSRCAGGNFQCRAVFSRRTSALLHLIICPPNQMVGSESCRARKKYCTNHTHPLSPQKSRFKRVWRRYNVEKCEAPIVYVVDDDADVRDGLMALFESVGLRCEAFSLATQFLTRKAPEVVSCLVLDVRLPGLSGLDVQAQLAEAEISIPVVFITGHGDIPMTVKAMKAGAVEFLTKPFREQ